MHPNSLVLASENVPFVCLCVHSISIILPISFIFMVSQTEIRAALEKLVAPVGCMHQTPPQVCSHFIVKYLSEGDACKLISSFFPAVRGNRC